LTTIFGFDDERAKKNEWVLFFDSKNVDLSRKKQNCKMGLSENSVALHPMVNDHYPY
jgi:hypothetical protein